MYTDPQIRPAQRNRGILVLLCAWAVVESVLLISVASRHDLLSNSVAHTATSKMASRQGTTLLKRASTPIFSSNYHVSPAPHQRSVHAYSEEPAPRKGPGTISRENEADDYWMSKDERDGKSPLADPLAWSAIAGLVVPFVILGIAIATGYVPIK
ncbi:hypothetical protein AAMO2058_000710100 [Amorphochlora amoebiformis]